MFPIHKERLYVVDIEVKPLPQYESKKYYAKINEDDEDNESHIDEPNFYPWFSEIYAISVAWGEDYATESAYFDGADILTVVTILSEQKLRLAAHNVFYDWVNLYYHFNLPLNFVYDSGVVSQCINNSDFITSFGLKQTTERLYNVITQDFEIKDYLKDNFKIPASKYGAFIHLCPRELIEKYCRLDAHYCWRIINDSPKWLKCDITKYMQLYMCEVKSTILQFIEGILIDREGFKRELASLQKEIADIEDKFLNHEELVEYIALVQQSKFNKKQSTLKTKKLDFEEWNSKESNKFNINSTKQLKDLFDFQKLHYNANKGVFEYPYVNTFTGSKVNNPNSPKLGTKFLHAYGTGGEILADKGEKNTLLQHIERALDESEYDGRVHAHINLLGTKSGRVSGSGVNIIATPIGESQYGKYLIVEDGYSIVCKDVKSLEPTLLACLSNDPVLKYATYEGEGKEPFIKDSILWIDDIYLMAAYSAPFMRIELEDKLDLTNWIKNSDAEKKKVKQLRSLSKTIVLATNYGAGTLKIQSQIRENLKLTIPLKNIQEFQDNYWMSLATAHQYKRRLEQIAQTQGYFVNIGGYPLTFYDRPGGRIEGTHKALNKMLQSSAAVVMKLINFYKYQLLKGRTDMIPLVCDWHDADFYKVKNESIEDYVLLTDKALEQVNNTLKLPLKLRLDFNKGRSFYDNK